MTIKKTILVTPSENYEVLIDEAVGCLISVYETLKRKFNKLEGKDVENRSVSGE